MPKHGYTEQSEYGLMYMMQKSRFELLNLTAYVTLAAVSAIALWDINRILVRWLAMGLLLTFGILQSRLPEQDGSRHSRRLGNLIILLQTGVIVGLIQVSGVGPIFITLLFILSVNAMLYNSLKIGMVWLAVFSLLSGWIFFDLDQGGISASLRYMLIYAGGFLFFGITTQALAQARQAQQQNNLLLKELQAKNQQLEEYARQVETLAIVEERNRLAREMHDTVGHRLTAAAVQLEAAQRLVPTDPDKASSLIGAGRQQVRDALQDVRQTVGRLREPVEIELSLPQALRRLTAGFQEATGLQIHLEIEPGDLSYSAAQRLALYRCAQEGLTNIQRHAEASQAWIKFNHSQHRAVLQISDNGKGVPDAGETSLTPGYGLRGLQERASQLGGSASLTNRPEGGAVLSFQIPVKEN